MLSPAKDHGVAFFEKSNASVPFSDQRQHSTMLVVN
jgi:hypothetical protein